MTAKWTAIYQGCIISLFFFIVVYFDVNKKEGGFPPVLICFADPYPKCQHCPMYTFHVMYFPP